MNIKQKLKHWWTLVNITNDYNSLRRERVIVRQQHRKDSSCQLLRFFKEKLGFLDKIFSKKQFFLFATKPWIITTKVWVICWSLRPRHTTQACGLIIHDIRQKPKSIPKEQICKRRHIALRENYTNKRLAKQADFDLDKINAISAADLALISSCQPCMLLCINRSWLINL